MEGSLTAGHWMLQQMERCWPKLFGPCLCRALAARKQCPQRFASMLHARHVIIVLSGNSEAHVSLIDRLCIYEHTVVTSAALVIAIHSEYVCTCLLLLALTIRLHNDFFKPVNLKPFRVGYARMVRHSLS